jgi:hypothetical protein
MGRSVSRSDERPDHFAGRPLAVDTAVRHERGRWMVDLTVVFADGVVRNTINDYPTEREATVAADWIRRSADRDVDGPTLD